VTAPLVSIALVTYNGEAHLAEQLDSLLAQTHAPIELVVCDDASTDGTWPLLQAHAPRFADCRLLRNPRNLGLRANVEQALRLARGAWIAPCDQDDVWLPTKIERLLATARAADATLAYCDSELVAADGRLLGRRVSDRLTMVDGSDPRRFALANCISGHAMLFRRSLLDRALPIPDVSYHDWWLAFVAASSGTIRYLDEPLVRFRQHASNASAFQGRAARDKPSAIDAQAAQQRDLDALAAFESRWQPFFIELAARWRERPLQRLTWPLARLLLRHREAVFAGKKRAPGGARHALKFLRGLR
jgi:glycosyltransferase involved in cell wall biosynthesis